MMPAIAMRIVRLCRDSDINANQLEKIIMSDQAFAGQLLQTANSALYRRAVSISSIQSAIVRVGLRHVKNLAIGLSANALHKLPTPRAQKLWQDSRTIASAAQIVGWWYGMPEDAYVVGLLHNVGMTILNNLDTERFEHCINLASEQRALEETQQEFFGVNHIEIGAALLKKWSLDQPFVDAIAAQAAPWNFPGTTDKGNTLATCIHASKVFMELPIFKSMGAEELSQSERLELEEELLDTPVIQHLKMSANQLSETITKLEKVFIQDSSDS
ncbi:MAG: HDOD domain-containing protein [Myxococcota bacterium]|nr:HDOD domain-containing protein [Myxococcota bacterium]